MSYITEQNQPPGWYPESTGETSGDVTVRPLSVVENGTYTAPSGTAYSPVDVNVEAGLTPEALSVVANGTYTAPSGKAYTPVSVNVPVGATTQSLTVTENGTYTAPSGSAYTPVVVNVPTGAPLPSVISAIDGGSFTLASDTLTGDHSVSHSLGVVPSGIAVWSDDIVLESYSVRTVNYLTIKGSSYIVMQINTNGTDRSILGTLASGDLSTSAFKLTVSANYYKAGATYKWLAWV